MKNKTIPDPIRARNYISAFYSETGSPEETVYAIFKNFIADENEAIKEARNFIETECETKTYTTKLFK